MNSIRYWKFKQNALEYFNRFFPVDVVDKIWVERDPAGKGYAIKYSVGDFTGAFHDGQHDKEKEVKP